MISTSVGLVATPSLIPGLIVSRLTDGSAHVADTLTASLSDGSSLTTLSWGSFFGAADYGITSTIVVPLEAESTGLFLNAQSATGLFSAAFLVSASPAIGTTIISSGQDGINVESLATPATSPGIALITDS